MRRIIILFAVILGMNIIAGTGWAIDASGIEIHGFISQGYLLTDHNNYMANTEKGTFQFNEMGVNFSTEAADQLHLAMQIFARDLGDVGNNKVVLGYAYGDYRWKNWLGIRAGKIKLDYGLYNETREMDMLRTGVMLPQSVYSEMWRDSFSNINGIGVYGYAPGGMMGKFSYNFQIGAMEFDKDSGFAKSFSPRMNESLQLTSMDADYAWFGTLQWHTPVPGLKLKGTYYNIEGLEANGIISETNKDGTTINSSVKFDVVEKDGYVFSLEYSWKNLTLIAEYSEDSYQIDHTFESTVQSTAAAPVASGSPGGTSPDGGNSSPPPPPKHSSQGWYVSASYRFTDWLESALSYSEYYPDKDNKGGDNKPPEARFSSWLKTTTFSTRFDINPYWVLKLEGSYNDGFGGINLAETNANDLRAYWWLFAAKVTFSF
jgi:hypothetical protein